MSQPGTGDGSTVGPVGTMIGGDGADMSPQQREAMYRAEAEAQYGDVPFGLPVSQLVADARAAGMNEQQIQKLAQDAEVLEGLQGSDQNYPGVDHQTIYQYVHQDLDSGQTTQLSDAWSQLVRLFEDFDGKFNEAVQQSQHHWEGESAEAARGYVRSLGSWSSTNSQQAQLASEAVYAQSSASETAKNTMPEPVQTDGLLKDFGSAVKDNPLDPIGAFNKAMETREKADAAHQQAAQVMTDYDRNLYEAASKQPAFSPPPEFGGAGQGGATDFGKSNVVDISGGDATSVSGYSGGGQPGGAPVTGGGPTTSGGGGYNGPSGNNPGAVPTPVAGRGPSTGAGQLPGTGPQGNGPVGPRVPTTGGGPGFSGMGPAPVGPMSGGGQAGGSTPYNSKLGGRAASAGFGPTGGGSAAGAAKGAAGAAGAAGAGAASGAAKGMTGGAGAAPGAAAAAGGSGARGGSGMMGGAGAGKGQQGGEEEEHQRPSWLVEADPDSLFGTDERTAPPVIGE